MRKIAYLLMLVVALTGCKSSKHLVAPEVEDVATSSAYLTSKLQLTIPQKKGSVSVSGTMKMKTNDRVRISLLMPILRTEMARIDITPDEILVVDRVNKRFVRASREELESVLPDDVGYSSLEKLILDASRSGSKRELSGQDLGLPSLEKAKVQLSDFSTKEFSMEPTEISYKYEQVSWKELMKILTTLL